MEFPSKNEACPKDPDKLFIWMLERAFPNHKHSNNALAQEAAPVLGYSKKQVTNWLTGVHSPNWRAVGKVAALAGVEFVVQRMENP